MRISIFVIIILLLPFENLYSFCEPMGNGGGDGGISSPEAKAFLDSKINTQVSKRPSPGDQRRSQIAADANARVQQQADQYQKRRKESIKRNANKAFRYASERAARTAAGRQVRFKALTNGRNAARSASSTRSAISVRRGFAPAPTNNKPKKRTYSRARHRRYLEELDKKERDRIHAEFHEQQARKLPTWEEREAYYKSIKNPKKLSKKERKKQSEKERLHLEFHEKRAAQLGSWEERKEYREWASEQRMKGNLDLKEREPEPSRAISSIPEDEPFEDEYNEESEFRDDPDEDFSDDKLPSF